MQVIFQKRREKQQTKRKRTRIYENIVFAPFSLLQRGEEYGTIPLVYSFEIFKNSWYVLHSCVRFKYFFLNFSTAFLFYPLSNPVYCLIIIIIASSTTMIIISHYFKKVKHLSKIFAKFSSDRVSTQ